MRDTAAYYNFVQYQLKGESKYIDEAYNHAMSILKMKETYNLSPHGITGANTQAKHINDIYAAYKSHNNF